MGESIDPSKATELWQIATTSDRAGTVRECSEGGRGVQYPITITADTVKWELEQGTRDRSEK